MLTQEIESIHVYSASPHERIHLIRQGIPASHVNNLAKAMSVTKTSLLELLSISPASHNRKVREEKALSTAESELVLGVHYLIGQVQHMVNESGNPAEFDAAKWIANWLQHPLPALGFDKPAYYMDTIEGQKMMSQLLAQMQSGAYA